MKELNFSDVSILVIGDVMLDKYFVGAVDRISPEAPVPVVNVKETKRVLGGAANVVNNIVGLKSNAYLLGAAGNDVYRDYLVKILDEKKISSCLLETSAPTVTKIRVVGNHQQIVRLDFEDIKVIDLQTEKKVINNIKKIIKDHNLIVISDYAKGFCTNEICQFVIKEAKANNIPVIIDPKGNNWNKYNGATFVTPNVKELADICGEKVTNSDDDIEKYGRKVLEKYKIENLLITRSEKGMTLLTKTRIINMPTEAKEVYDVSGAGDTVVASLAVAVASKHSIVKAAEVANKAAGIVVSKLGTAPILAEDFKIDDEKIISKSDIKDKIIELRKVNKKIVFTNGCFDILHRGHVIYLKAAKKLGDILIVGLNTDSSVKRLKGNDRPINNELDRAEVLISLKSVDYVVLFDEDTPYDLIKTVRPDILVKGADYKKEEVVGREFAKETILVDFVDGYSTTKTISKIK